MIVILAGGDFDGAHIDIPFVVEDFYVYSGDMINVYHYNLVELQHDSEELDTADFLLDESMVDFAIPENSYSVELIWDVDNQEWKQ